VTIIVSPPVKARLAGVAAELKAATGRAVSYDEAIQHLLDAQTGDGR